MKSQLLVLTLLVIGFPIQHTCQAQDLGLNSGSPGTHALSLDPVEGRPVAFSGRVQIEGGGEVTKDIVVVLDCGFGDRARAHVDSRGRFTLMLNQLSSTDGWAQSRASDTLAACRLRAEAPGYRSSSLDVEGHQSGIVEVGTITITPIAIPADGFAVSVGSLAAPDSAKKDFKKGQGQARKGKWDAACDHFRKAIRAYPRYALAWLELGRAQLHQNDLRGAEQSFQQAATHDSKFLPAYIELARLQSSQGQWKALATTTGTMVELAPESSASLWFLDSAANYNLQNLPRAQSSAERGLRLDTAHRIPQLEYLYGLILASRADYSSAVEHIKAYLSLRPHADDIHEAQARLKEFERLASAQVAQGAH